MPGAAMAIFGNAGQVCSAGSRLFVERAVYDEFVGRVVEFAGTLKVGDGTDLETQMGPVVSARQLERVLGYVEEGRRVGATPVTGGTRLMEGDLAAPFDTVEEVARRANDTPFGLGSGVWTNDVRRAHRLAGMIRAGSVWVNTYQAMDPAVPFGGHKQSGYGRESGQEQLDEYLNVKAVWVRTG